MGIFLFLVDLRRGMEGGIGSMNIFVEGSSEVVEIGGTESE